MTKKKKKEYHRAFSNPGTCGSWEMLEEEGRTEQDKKNKSIF